MEGDASTGSQNADDDDFKIKGAATKSALTTKISGETCTICLESITERAVATPCNHLTFDFLCLVSWLQEQSKCPLCKAEVKEVQYDWRSTNDYKTYHVPRPTTRSLPIQTHGRRRTPRPNRTPVVSEDPSLQRRRLVYRHRLYSLHVGTNRSSGYRDCSPGEYSRSPELQSKTRAFLRRELQVFSFLGNRNFLMEYIVAILKKYEIKSADGKAEELLKEFLGDDNSRILLHELQAWLRSPYSILRAWDNVVQYRDASEGVAKREQ